MPNTDILKKQIELIEKCNINLTDDLEIIKNINKSFVNADIDIFDLKNRGDKKKILSVEVGKGHDIIRPSIYKYFTDLGYEVDFLLYGDKPENRWNFFLKVPNPKYRVLVGNEAFLLAALSLPIMQEYDYIMFNTNFVYTIDRFDTDWDYKALLRKMRVPDRCKHGYLTIPPHPGYYKNTDTNMSYFTSLESNNAPLLSISYFGNVDITPKSDKTIFLITGNINTDQKNHDMIIDAANTLRKEGFNNFELWINGEAMKELNLTEDSAEYIKYLGENKPETLIPILEKADYIIAGFDSKNDWQKRVYSSGTCSAAFMYALGFGKIYICEDIFAKPYGLNDENSIIYKHDNLIEALKQAINLSKEDYSVMQKNLLNEAKRREEKSLSDIKIVLEKAAKTYKKRENKHYINNFQELIKFIIFDLFNYIRLNVCYMFFPEKREHYKEKLKKYL